MHATNCLIFLLTAWLFVFGQTLYAENTLTATNDKPPVSEFIDKIIHAGNLEKNSHLVTIEASEEELSRFWHNFGKESYPIVKEMITSYQGDLDGWAKEFLQQFEHGDINEKTLLFIATEDVFAPLNLKSLYSDKQSNTTLLYRNAQIAMAMAQLEYIKDNPSFLLSLYQMISWRRRFLNPGKFSVSLINNMRKEIVDQSSDNNRSVESWHLRNFLLCCVATNREDLITKEVLKINKRSGLVVTHWHSWFLLSVNHLTPHSNGCSWKVLQRNSLLAKPDAAGEYLPELRRYPSHPISEQASLMVLNGDLHPMITLSNEDPNTPFTVDISRMH